MSNEKKVSESLLFGVMSHLMMWISISLSYHTIHSNAFFSSVLTFFCCFLVSILGAIISGKKDVSIIILSLVFMLALWWGMPGTSANDYSRKREIYSGNIFYIAPLWILLGSFIGYISGLYIKELRRKLNEVNNRTQM